jgi:hypothetical protein
MVQGQEGSRNTVGRVEDRAWPIAHTKDRRRISFETYKDVRTIRRPEREI